MISLPTSSRHLKRRCSHTWTVAAARAGAPAPPGAGAPGAVPCIPQAAASRDTPPATPA